MTTGKRLAKYALSYKKIIFAALVMLTISVVTDLAGPFIAKNIIDQHILGIESVWVETTEGKNTALYQGKFYKKEKNFANDEEKGNTIRVLQVTARFVIVEGNLEFDGKRTFKEGVLTVKKGTKKAEYDAQILTTKELMAFYQLEIPGIITLLAIYFCLLVISSIFQYGQRFL